jgi:sulfatase modifying factor 1
MSLRKNITVFFSAAIATMAIGAGRPSMATPIDWVRVGNPNNPADSTGFGTVGHIFDIMKFEFTNAQYAEFLNAIDPQGTNPNGVYFATMATGKIGGITNAGTVDGSRYVVRTNKADKPVSYVTWFDAARVANWLHNGAQTYATSDATENAPQNVGAYTLGTVTSGNTVAKNPGALYWVPTENEWYKAAFYNPTLNDGAGGYTLYGNGFNETPAAVTANSVGDGSAGPTGNSATWQSAAVWAGNPPSSGTSSNVTTVGTNGGSSYYGAFDMSGNLTEWNSLTGEVGENAGWRGGQWSVSLANSVILSSGGRFDVGPGFDNSNVVGFRLVAVPEPSAGICLLSGVIGVGYWMRRRRK